MILFRDGRDILGVEDGGEGEGGISFFLKY